MSTIDKIMGAIGRHGDDCIRDADAASASFEGLREMIAAALADARREGAEAMQAGAFDACVAQADADRRFAKSERNAGAVDCATELAEIIRALPLPTGERQAVLLVDHMTDAHADAVLRAAGSALRNYTMQSTRDVIRQAVRAIETAVLAANGLEVRRG